MSRIWTNETKAEGISRNHYRNSLHGKGVSTLIAEMVGLSREQVSKRYGHLFAAPAGTKLSDMVPSGARATTHITLETSSPSFLRRTG